MEGMWRGLIVLFYLRCGCGEDGVGGERVGPSPDVPRYGASLLYLGDLSGQREDEADRRVEHGNF